MKFYKGFTLGNKNTATKHTNTTGMPLLKERPWMLVIGGSTVDMGVSLQYLWPPYNPYETRRMKDAVVNSIRPQENWHTFP